MFKPWVLMGVLAIGLLTLGCSERLETGYEPRRLGASVAERRGYYAPPYTPEAMAAEKEGGAAAAVPGFHKPGE